MWTSLVSSAALPPLASLSRVFLGPIVPGWVDEWGHVRLPLRMESSEVCLGISHDDRPGLRAWHRENQSYFASRFPQLGLFGSKAEFQNELRPAWLQNAASCIRTTIETYLPTISSSPRLSPIARVLKEREAALHDLLSSCLYVGPGYQPEGYCLIPQDLMLYGEELRTENGLYDLLRLLETVAHVETLIRSGMTDIISITDDAEMRRLHDAVSGRAQEQGLRPHCFYEPDEEGHIQPLRPSSAMVLDGYDDFEAALVRQNRILLGCFLFAELGLGEDDFLCLLNRLTNLACLKEDRTPAIVLEHLGASSAIHGPKAPLMARFLAAAIREAGSASQRD